MKFLTPENFPGAKVNFQSRKFAPEAVVAQYIAFHSTGNFTIYDVNLAHETVREFWAAIDALPEGVKKLNKEEDVGKYPNQKFIGGMTFDERQAANPKNQRIRAWGG